MALAGKHKARAPLFFLVLVIMQVVHSSEEYSTHLYDWFPVVTGHIREMVDILPIIEISGRTFVVLNVALIAFLLSVCPFVYQRRRWALRVAGVVAVIEVLNGLAHISAAVYVGSYFPGCVSAIGLVMMGVMLLKSLFTKHNIT
jgi:hypothetical protein